VFDASDVQVASSTNSGTGSETIDYAASAGTYFAQVTQFSGSPISYDLDLAATYDIGTVGASPVSLDNYTVGTFDPTDTFEFDITGNRQIGLSLHGMNGGDADLRLYSDSNNNGVFDASDVQVASSTNSGTGSETIDYAASAGTYFAQVTQFSGSPISYDLDLAATYDIGTVGASPVSLDNYTVSTFDPTDTFEFDITGSRTINLNLHNISAGDDADLRLFRDSNNNGVFDASDVQVASSLQSGNSGDTISYRASSGTYFAQVEQYALGSSGAVSYDLDLSATVGRASNLLGADVQLGNLSGDQVLTGGVSNQNTTDTYAFSLGLFEGVNIRLNGLSNNADIRLIQDSNGNNIVDSGEVLGSSVRSGNASELISGIDLSGDYLLQVYQSSGSTPYTLTMDHYNTTFA
ncbi:pre-peptidase C-terminal domain-containing protein, partial [Leptothoe sp. PORK10 BA2]|uniref:pre-peptidase C-terminal domain-containing protein n=1 Tax=Leptothoe sp. PORK10 BA2 TaxID=3110254 RepID=UPI002B22125F